MLKGNNYKLVTKLYIYMGSNTTNKKNKREEEELPKWMNFICPSCAISYGISKLIKIIKK